MGIRWEMGKYDGKMKERKGRGKRKRRRK